jgi:hypothetical protein
MILNELFENPAHRDSLTELRSTQSYPTTTLRKTSRHWKTEFQTEPTYHTPSGFRYWFEATAWDEAGMVWRCRFSQVDPDDQPTFTITGTGHAPRVMATVIKEFVNFVNEVSPQQIFFEADPAEPSRTRLYQRLCRQVSTVLPQYTCQFQGPDRFVVKKKVARASQSLTELRSTQPYSRTAWHEERRMDYIKWTCNFTTEPTPQNNQKLTYICTAISYDNSNWEFFFGLLNLFRQDFSITGTGHAPRVMATVIDAFVSFVWRQSPDTVEFSSNPAEPSRTRLYHTLCSRVSSMLPEYTCEFRDPDRFVVRLKNFTPESSNPAHSQPQQLTELSTRPAAWRWVQKTDSDWQARFEIPNHKSQDPLVYVCGFERFGDSDIWDLKFHLEADAGRILGAEPQGFSSQITWETGSQQDVTFAVFSTVVNILRDFTQQTRAQCILFTAMGRTTSRVDLYTRFCRAVSQYLPQYTCNRERFDSGAWGHMADFSIERIPDVTAESLEPSKFNLGPGKLLKKFLRFAVQRLGLKTLPPIKFQRQLASRRTTHQTFGYYDPHTQQIRVAVGNRHIMDTLRTLAHELVHHRQRLQGDVQAHSGDTGSAEENQANALAGILMREFADQAPQGFDIGDPTKNNRSCQ